MRFDFHYTSIFLAFIQWMFRSFFAIELKTRLAYGTLSFRLNDERCWQLDWPPYRWADWWWCRPVSDRFVVSWLSALRLNAYVRRACGWVVHVACSRAVQLAQFLTSTRYDLRSGDGPVCNRFDPIKTMYLEKPDRKTERRKRRERKRARRANFRIHQYSFNTKQFFVSFSNNKYLQLRALFVAQFLH